MTTATMVVPATPFMSTAADERHRIARWAGVAYLFLVVQGVFALEYVPRVLMVPGDATATAARILAGQPLFTAWLVNSLVLLITYPLLAFLLYRLFERVNRGHAAAMLVLVLVQVPQAIIELQRQFSALELLRGNGFLSAMEPAQRQVQAMLLLDPAGTTIAPVMLFWGLWLLPLGALVYRSGFMPRWLGAWLFLNGVAYVALSAARAVAPHYSNVALAVAMPLLLAEVVFMLWLLVRGAPGRRAEVA